MHCPHCGTPLPNGAVFCGTCGLKIEPAVPTEMPMVTVREDAIPANIPTESTDFRQNAPLQPKPPRAKRGLVLPILCICLAAVLIASVVINVFQWMQSVDLQTAVDEKTQTIDKLNQEIDDQDATIQEQNLTIVDQEATIQEQNSKLWFYEEYVVVVPDDGSELYHTYGCDHFDDSYFWAFNLAAAEQKGYAPCPYCQ